MMHLTRRGPRAALALAGIGLATVLAACSQNPEPATADPVADSQEQSFDDWQLAYNDCMKDQGVDLSGSGSETDVEGSMQGFDDDSASVDMDEVNAAGKICEEKVGPSPVQADEPDFDELNQSMLDFAACMREAGHDFPDPEMSADGAMELGEQPDDVDPEVAAACSEEAGVSMLSEVGQ
ncbi:hypothetical protein GCM10009809_23200 [Isoptericola hypogeus]|uniref:Secreted protein n=1 Tax=Isoptericola hypogeus TaxID=300179 RepID=A0ABN2JH05_9MICO